MLPSLSSHAFKTALLPVFFRRLANDFSHFRPHLAQVGLSSGKYHGQRYLATGLQLTRQPNGDVIGELEKRGLVSEVTSRGVRQHLLDDLRTVYLGIDPTARSLHIGNLLAIVTLLHFALKGHQTIILLGGATGSVGDPSGRSSERVALSQEELDSNIQSISLQVTNLLKSALQYATDRLNQGPIAQFPLPLVKNNLEWTKSLTLLDFLSTVGKTARVSRMLARESVKQRMEIGLGISFTEFAYQLLQAYDFSELRARYGCTVQLGGSDQYGNIMCGIELMARLRTLPNARDIPDEARSANSAYGVTTPLLTTAKGEKLGKSAGNAIWLDPELTPPVELYQAFMSTPDSEVVKYLKMLTFVPVKEIDQLSMDGEQREQRQAQKLLAREITLMVHGNRGLQQAFLATDFLFPRTSHPTVWKQHQLDEVFKNSPHRVRLAPSDVFGYSIESLAKTSGLCRSKGEARALLQSGALTLNHKQVQANARVAESDLPESGYMLLMRGKGAYRLVKIDAGHAVDP